MYFPKAYKEVCQKHFNLPPVRFWAGPSKDGVCALGGVGWGGTAALMLVLETELTPSSPQYWKGSHQLPNTLGA